MFPVVSVAGAAQQHVRHIRMKTTLIPLLVVILGSGCVAAQQKIELPLKDGEYIFTHKFAEAEQHTIQSIKVTVKIKGNHIAVINNDKFDVFPEGILEEGTLMWHTKSQQWIIAHQPSDADLDDVGGCSDGPTVIDLRKRIYWTC